MTPAPDATSPASQVGMEGEARNETLIERLEGMADEFAKVRPHIGSDGPTETLLRESAKAIRDLEAENARLRSAPIPLATCQACGGTIEGWICQSCDREFHENDKGDLVMDEGHAPIPAVQSGAVAWRGRMTPTGVWEFRDYEMRTGDLWCEVEPLYAAPQSEPLPGGVGEREKIAQIIRDHVEVGDIGECSIELVGHEAAAEAILAALSGKEQG